MKILLIGLGSIGQRHLRNILNLGYNAVSIVSRSGKLPEEFSHLTVFNSVDEALSYDSFNAAIICTPTAFHTTAFKALVNAKISKIYIEKPVSHSLEGLSTIAKQCEDYKIQVIIGYDLHFDPGLQKVKELLDGNIIGRLVSANAQVGQYLPDWRPYEDYKKGMSALKETGGGVMLDLVHEFDYLIWLLGQVKSVACQYTNSGALEIETEDVSDVLLRFQSGVIATIHLDYLQSKLVRNCMITGYEGSIFWNLAESKVIWLTHKDRIQKEFSYQGYERNNRFNEIMEAFLSSKNDPRLTTLEAGIESLKLVLAAKHSSENEIFVNLKTFKA